MGYSASEAWSFWIYLLYSWEKTLDLRIKANLFCLKKKPNSIGISPVNMNDQLMLANCALHDHNSSLLKIIGPQETGKGCQASSHQLATALDQGPRHSTPIPRTSSQPPFPSLAVGRAAMDQNGQMAKS